MRSLIVSTSHVFCCSALLLASCDYQIPSAAPNLETGGSGGGGVSASTGIGGFDGTSSSVIASSAASSSSSSGSTMMDTCGDSVKGPEEDCDDGGNRAGDGCDEKCAIENHDGCDVPILELARETIIIQNTTVGAADDIMQSATKQFCAEGTRVGGDLIYAIAPTVNGSFTATLEANYNFHFLHIRNACPGDVSNEIACDYGSTIAEVDSSTLTVAPGTILYVIVDGHEMDAGDFTLTLTLN